MSEEEIERIAELIFQKFLEKEQEHLDSMDIDSSWLVYDPATGDWHATFTPNPNNKEIFTQRLVALNIEKQELIAEEKYEELIKLQEKIDAVKEQLKKYKD